MSDYSPPMDTLVLYSRPSDYPDHFVIRRWSIELGVVLPGDVVGTYETSDAARVWVDQQEPGRVWFEAGPQDDAAIVGSWI